MDTLQYLMQIILIYNVPMFFLLLLGTLALVALVSSWLLKP